MTGGESVPVGVPVAWSNQATNHAPQGARARTRATTPTALPHPLSPRVGRRGLAAVRGSLSVRDMDVLRSVAAHRYLTTRQVEGFFFTDHATALTGARVARRTLRRLAAINVVTHIERRVGGVRAGSASYVWTIGPVGDRILRAEAGGTRTRQREPGRLFLDHCLAIADAHLDLVQAHGAAKLELVEVQCEPDCWRPFSGLGGARLVLQPDLYVVTGDPADSAFVNRWFVEIDRGTENPARLLAKCAHYQAYRRSGIEQQSGGAFPLVVWVMLDAHHAVLLKAAIERDANLAHELFRVTTATAFLDVVKAGPS